MKRRSWLFVPGNHERKLNKASSLPADVIIVDWEDAVPEAEKRIARELTARFIPSGGEKEIYIRINSTDSPFFREDLQALPLRGLTGLVLPKAEERSQLERLDQALQSLEKGAGIAAGRIRVVPLIESARGLVQTAEVAAAPRVQALAFGSVDFTLDIDARLTQSGKELLYARSRLVILSRVAGIEAPIDGVQPDLSDRERLRAESQQVRDLGFQGKLAIHPEQLSVIHDSFQPTATEVEEAKRIVEAYEDGLRQGSGAVQVGGMMVDRPVVERAQRLLKQAGEG